MLEEGLVLRQARIEIDQANGGVTVDGFAITTRTKPNALPALFQVGKELPVRVLRDTVPCLFATASVEDEGLKVKVDLRFERGALVSTFLEVADPADQKLDAAAFYGSFDERANLHLSWLKKKLGPGQDKHTRYQWGVAGVAIGRSSEVHIFLHNTNNTWAFGDR